MSETTLLPGIEGIALDCIASTPHSIVLRLSTVARFVACPLCGRPSERIHSRYDRTLADLPWNRGAVHIHLRSRKLFCDNPDCKRAIFAEPLTGLAARYARKTLRLQQALYIIGYALGGKAGARMSLELGLATSPDTLLRRVREVAQEQKSVSMSLRIVGVDDWAFRKGHRYGTILVDLERHSLVDLLSERSAESLSAWLKQHPGIEVISRDRAGVYAEGARQGVPQAQQVADRWHLLDNLGDAMQRLTAQHAPSLRSARSELTLSTLRAYAQHAPSLRLAAEKMRPETAEVQSPIPAEPSALPRAEQRRRERNTEREACYHKIRALRQQGWTVPAIVAEVDVSKRTVQRFLRAAKFPERARRRRQPRQTDGFRAYLRQRIEAGCQNASQLYREIKAQGYSGAYTRVYYAVRNLTDCGRECNLSPSQKARSPAESPFAPPPSRTLAWWLQGHLSSRPEVAAQQEQYLAHLYELVPVLREAGELAQEFARTLKSRSGSRLDAWLESAQKSGCAEMRQFAQGLCQDLAAVRNAVTSNWSNGQTEGQVNRLKMLKRQMYGRANFDLLRARVLPMARAA